MKITISKILLLAFLSINFVSCAQKKDSDDQNKHSVENDATVIVSLISPQDLNKANKDILLIDVRTPEEYGSGHLENSINIDYKAADFKNLLSEIDKDQTVYIYCRSGVRSGKSGKMMEEMGFKKVYDLEGGILNWQKNDLKIVE